MRISNCDNDILAILNDDMMGYTGKYLISMSYSYLMLFLSWLKYLQYPGRIMEINQQTQLGAFLHQENFHPSRGMMIFCAHMALMDFKLETQTLGGLDFGRFQKSQGFRSAWFGLYSSRWQEWIWSDLSKMSGCWFGTWILFFPYWDFHNPNWRTHIFQRGRYTTNQMCSTIRTHWSWNPQLPSFITSSGSEDFFPKYRFFSGTWGAPNLFARNSGILNKISTLYHRK